MESRGASRRASPARRHVRFLHWDVAAAGCAAYVSAPLGAVVRARLEVARALEDARHGPDAATHRTVGTAVDDRRTARVSIGTRDRARRLFHATDITPAALPRDA